MNKTTTRRERTETFVKHMKEEREEKSSFAKILIGMVIV